MNVYTYLYLYPYVCVYVYLYPYVSEYSYISMVYACHWDKLTDHATALFVFIAGQIRMEKGK